MTILTIGKRLISLDQIAYVEPFDPAANPEFKPDKNFKARLVLLNRDVVLTESSPKEFSDANGFHLLEEDNVAVSPSLATNAVPRTTLNIPSVTINGVMRNLLINKPLIKPTSRPTSSAAIIANGQGTPLFIAAAAVKAILQTT